MTLDDLLPSDPLAAYSEAADRARRAIARLVRLYGRRHDLVARVRVEMVRHVPELAAQLKLAQVEAWLSAAKSLVGELPALPARQLPALLPAFGRADTPDGRPATGGIVFPQVVTSARYVRTRVPVTAQEFDELDHDARRVAFTVARVQTADAVEAVRDAIADDVAGGGTLREFRENVAEALDGSGLSNAQVEAIYRTHVGRAYTAGQSTILEAPAVRSAFPYRMYSATHDSRVRPEHLALETMGLDGTAVYRSDDPFWDTYSPPWAWNCRCHSIPLSLADAAKLGVREAREWLASGKPPAVPEWVKPPGFPLPKGWVPTGRRLQPLG